MLTISQLAAYAGVTVRTVRHYHQLGLLPEPARDGSGYRRYRGEDVIVLKRITVLARAGVPLTRVADLLVASPESFAAGLAEVDRQLVLRIEEMRRWRADLAALPSAERLCVPAEVSAILDRMRAYGVRERTVTMERDGWILVAAAFPSYLADGLAWRRRSLDDEEYRELMLRYDEAFDWDVDDPHIETLARDTVEVLLRLYPVADAEAESRRWDTDVNTYRMLSELNVDASPAWARLSAVVSDLARERGYPIV